MSKGKNSVRELPFWAAVVFCDDASGGPLVGSFLSFYAQNRFKALQFIREALPESPEYLDEWGKLKPIRIIDLRQIRESESEEWAARFYTFFYNLFPEDPQISAKVWN
jgi:hypothetical protein